MCHIAEYERSQNAVAAPASGAWLDASTYLRMTTTGSSIAVACASSEFGRYATEDSIDNCRGWTDGTDGARGTTIATDGSQLTRCDVAQPVACCR